MLRSRVHRSLGEVEPAAWNALAGANPFVRHEFLHALESTGSLSASLGWRARPITVWDGDTLVAAIPAYLKSNSHGEFVFDHAWADAYHRLGIAYYPKLLIAVPYSPVPGPRLMFASSLEVASRLAVVQSLSGDLLDALGVSTVHANFCDAASADAFNADGWLARQDIQFHWSNRGYETFDDFLGELTSKRRKEIRRERAAFATPAWSFDWLDGESATDADLDFAYDCYVRTFEDKGNYPALQPAFFRTIAKAMPRSLRLLIAREHGEPAAMAFCLAGGGVLYGRYWGAIRPVAGLHFECCYYRGIERAIAEKLERFEPGAQGEHKLARGFLPVRTQSRHYIADPTMRSAIARSLKRESAWIEQYERSLLAHSPFAARA